MRCACKSRCSSAFANLRTMSRTLHSDDASAVVPYFRPAAFTFLRALARHNDREWFKPRKAQYEAELREPMLAVVRRINAAMEEFAPQYVRPADKELFRIYRDTRFASDKRPYKTHVAAWWRHEGMQKTSGAGFYFHVEAKEVLIAAGVYMPEKEQLMAIRHWLLEHHAELRKLLKRPLVRRLYDEMEGNPLVRAPKGFPAEHPGMDLIRCRQWGLSAALPAKAALEKNIAEVAIRYFKAAAPVVDALNRPLIEAFAPKRKIFFGLR